MSPKPGKDAAVMSLYPVLTPAVWQDFTDRAHGFWPMDITAEHTRSLLRLRGYSCQSAWLPCWAEARAAARDTWGCDLPEIGVWSPLCHGGSEQLVPRSVAWTCSAWSGGRHRLWLWSKSASAKSPFALRTNANPVRGLCQGCGAPFSQPFADRQCPRTGGMLLHGRPTGKTWALRCRGGRRHWPGCCDDVRPGIQLHNGQGHPWSPTG